MRAARAKLQSERRTRVLALFNLAIDCKRRRANIRQRKTVVPSVRTSEIPTLAAREASEGFKYELRASLAIAAERGVENKV